MTPCPCPDQDCAYRLNGECVLMIMPKKCLAKCPPQAPLVPKVTAKSPEEMSMRLSRAIGLMESMGFVFPLRGPSSGRDDPMYAALNAAQEYVVAMNEAKRNAPQPQEGA